MNQNISNFDNSTELGYKEIFDIFWRRRSHFVGICGGILALTIPLVLIQKPIYKSSMQLLIEPNYQNKYDSGGFDPTQSRVEIDYATQVNLMRSSQLLSRAVEKLKSSYPDITIAEIKESFTVSQLREKEAKKEVGTKIFQADYRAQNAEKTQKVLEAIQDVYLAYNLDQQSKRLKEGLRFINEQIPEVRKKLTNSERNLEALLTKHNLIEPSKQAFNMTQVLTDIQQKREEIKAQYKQSQGKSLALQQQLELSGKAGFVDSKLSLSNRYQNLLNELQKIDLELEKERTRFKDSNPIIQNLIIERNNKKLLLEQEAKKILGKTELNSADLKNLENSGQLDVSDLDIAQALTMTRNELIGLQSREQSLALTEQKLKDKLNQFPSLIAEYNSLKQEVQVNQATLKKLLESRQEIGIIINRGGFSWEVIEPPKLGVKVSPVLAKDLALGVILSVFSGVVSIVILEASDNKIRLSKQLQDQANLPLLGTTPGLTKVKNNGFAVRLPFLPSEPQKHLPINVIEWLPFRESLDLVYENIQLISQNKQNSQINSVAITSAISGEGKSTITLGLALSAARRHKKVLVIDGDLRCPSIHEKLGIPDGVGLSDLLTEKTVQPNILQVSLANSKIDVLTSGAATEDPIKLLSSDKLQELIRNFEKKYDLVLIDTSPVIGMVDAIKIASCCSGTVLVARLEKASFSDMAETYSLLSRLNLLGTVANDSKEVQHRYEKNRRYLPSVEL